MNEALICEALTADENGDSERLAELIDAMEPMELREFQKRRPGGFFGFKVK